MKAGKITLAVILIINHDIDREYLNDCIQYTFSRILEFENLFSAMNPTWGYSEFIEWEKVIDPANGYVKDNVLKFQVRILYIEIFVPLCQSFLRMMDILLLFNRQAFRKNRIKK